MRGTRYLRAITCAALAGATVAFVLATPAAAVTSVTTEAELRAAFADGTTSTIVLANSIDLVDCSPSGGDLDRASALTLDGAGFTLRQTCPGERVIESASGTLTLQDVTVTGGDQLGPHVALGGGVRASGAVTLVDTTVTGNRITAVDEFAGGGGVASDGVITITDSHVNGNFVVARQGWGGGVFNGAIQEILVTNSTVDGNTISCSAATNGMAFCSGGGIANILTLGVVTGASDDLASAVAGGRVVLTQSSVDENTAESSGDSTGPTQAWSTGGGIRADTVEATDSHIDANALRSHAELVAHLLGGGVDAMDVTLVRSTADGNSAEATGADENSGFGGGVLAEGLLDATDSSISDNRITAADSDGGAQAGGVGTSSARLHHVTIARNAVEGPVAPGGGVWTKDIEMVASTVADNTAVATATDGTAYAGGIYVQGGTIEASTISGNRAEAPGYAHAGALLHHVRGTLEDPGLADPDLTISNSTITANVAESIEQPSVAGGVEELSGWSTTLVFSTVSGNAADAGANVAVRPGLPDYPNSPSGGTVAITASVLTDPQGGGSNCDAVTLSESAYAYVTDDSCGTDASVDPLLGALADNGGPTLTMRPAATSLLLDRVPTEASCLALVTADQRGVARPEGSACDIGAVEREVPPDPTPTPAAPLPGAAAADGPTAAPAVVAEPKFTG